MQIIDLCDTVINKEIAGRNLRSFSFVIMTKICKEQLGMFTKYS